jgi:hypothetical protein
VNADDSDTTPPIHALPDEQGIHSCCGRRWPDGYATTQTTIPGEVTCTGVRPGDQPLPVPNDGPSMHDLVIADVTALEHHRLAEELRKRRDLGLQRYGSLLQAHNGRDALRDLLEECLDGIVYARQAAIEGYDAAGLGIVERRLIAAATVAILVIDERDGTPTDPGTPRPPVRSTYPPESGTGGDW